MIVKFVCNFIQVSVAYFYFHIFMNYIIPDCTDMFKVRGSDEIERNIIYITLSLQILHHFLNNVKIQQNGYPINHCITTDIF